MSPATPPSSGGSTLSERLTAALAHSRRTKREIEVEAELTKGYLSTLTAGKRGARSGVGPDILRRLSEALHVSFEWLATGDGAMLRNGPPSPRPGAGTDFSERFPNCERTIAYLKDVKEISPRVAQLVRAAAVELGCDLPGEAWHALAKAVHRQVAEKAEASSEAVLSPRSARTVRQPPPPPSELDLENTVEIDRPRIEENVSRFPTLETPELTRHRQK